MSRILLTGASGYLGTKLRAALAAEGHTIIATDIRPAADGADIAIADLADASAMDGLMRQGIDAVVHLGGMANEGDWDLILRANVMGSHTLFEAARRHGVGRIIYASSYHVAGFYPTEAAPLPVDIAYRPDTLYGVSKVFGETLARFYFDKHGVQSLSIRICSAHNPKTVREARNWCDPADLAAMVSRALAAEQLGCQVLYGISDNPGAFFVNPPDNSLGWAPKGSSLQHDFPDPRAAIDLTDPANRLLGGGMALRPALDAAE